jgi:Flp pilus assembly pilin Flp
MKMFKNFWKDDSGQDLIEYSLLLALICLASAAIFLTLGDSLRGIWVCGSTRAYQANSIVYR